MISQFIYSFICLIDFLIIIFLLPLFFFCFTLLFLWVNYIKDCLLLAGEVEPHGDITLALRGGGLRLGRLAGAQAHDHRVGRRHGLLDRSRVHAGAERGGLVIGASGRRGNSIGTKAPLQLLQQRDKPARFGRRDMGIPIVPLKKNKKKNKQNKT